MAEEKEIMLRERQADRGSLAEQEARPVPVGLAQQGVQPVPVGLAQQGVQQVPADLAQQETGQNSGRPVHWETQSDPAQQMRQESGPAPDMPIQQETLFTPDRRMQQAPGPDIPAWQEAQSSTPGRTVRPLQQADRDRQTNQKRKDSDHMIQQNQSTTRKAAPKTQTQQDQGRKAAPKTQTQQDQGRKAAPKPQTQQDQGRKTAPRQQAQQDQNRKMGKPHRSQGNETGKRRVRSGRRPGKYSANRREIIVSCSFFLVLFAVMIGYLGYFTATSEQEMINNSYNSRQEILLSRNYRGTIFSRDGEVLAETVLDNEQNETREYPFGNLFSHVVGYSTQGRMGVEALANYYLINTSTSLNNKVANDMAGVKNPGDSVYTTLDVQLQEVADSELGIYRGAIVVTEVSTGKVLAMVSHPDFDPNEIQEIWDSLVENDSSSVLLNRATQGLYPPGSTFKIMTALEYMRENPEDYARYSFQCPGYFQADGSRINCYHGSSHGQVDFYQSFAKSCNASFANIGMGLDREAFAETLRELLFNEELPMSLSYVKSSTAVAPDISQDSMLQTSIGQGLTQITPMHLNMITCAIANDGILMRPYFVDHVENDAGNVIKTFKPSTYGRLMSEEESEALTQLMTEVVEKGTARKLSGLTYTAAGKTGSAEYNNIKGDSHAWFTGFAPAENPEVCVTIIVEGAGSGGDYAVPIAKRIFDAYFREK